MTEQVKKDDKNVLDQPIEAAAQVAEGLEKNNQGLAEDQTVETIAQADEAEVTPAAEAIVAIPSPEVTASGVRTHHESDLAQGVITAHPQEDVKHTGEHHPAHTVDGSSVDLDPSIPSFTTLDAKAVRRDPTNASAAHELVQERKGRIARFNEFLQKKLFAGTKISEQTNNLSEKNVQFPTGQPAHENELKKAA